MDLRARRAGTLIVAFGALVAVFLHVRAGTTFPTPWPDEIDFLTPAHQLARHFTFATPSLRSPKGMLWVPDFLYFVLAPAIRVFPSTLTVGRAVACAAILCAGSGFWCAVRRSDANALAGAMVVAVFLVSPRVVIAGNMIRHEAVVIAVLAWATWATLARRPAIAIALAALMVLTHPVAIPMAAVVVVSNIRGPWGEMRRLDWAVAAVVAAIALWQVLHVALAWDVARAQLEFQLQRKRRYGSPFQNHTMYLAVAFVGAGVLLAREGRRNAAVLLALSGACLGACISGHEIWYGVYGREVTVLFLALAVLAALRDWRPITGQLLIPVATVLLLLVQSPYQAGFFGMRLGHKPNEFAAFTDSVRAQLTKLGALPEHHTILVNSVSGLPWPAETDRIGTLTIVKATIDRPARTGYDYLLWARTICCLGQEPTPTNVGTPVVKVTSPSGVFDATIFQQR